MIILGIVNDEVSGACLVVDGKLVAAVSEERYTRVKNDRVWPQRSIDYVLNSQGVALSDIDHVAYGWSASFDAERHLLMFFDRVVDECRNNPDAILVFRDRLRGEIEIDAKTRGEFLAFTKEHGLENRTHLLDHHECHALSAYAYSPFDKALVLTCDGRGDYQSLTVSRYDGPAFEVLYRGSSIDSLGHFYGRITKLLGFRVNRHEGKVTGLAAYGDPMKYLPLMEQMISYRDGGMVAHIGHYYRPWASGARFSDELKNIIEKAKREDIAAAAQRHLENILTNVARYYLEKTDLRYICMAGGVFANVALNKRIRDLPGIENVFIQPHMSDGGLALGAAGGLWYKLTGTKVRMPSMYLGPEFSSDEIEKSLSEPDLAVTKDGDIVAAAIQAMKLNEVVGWFQGRMEHGPRALGHRSVFYHCKDVSVNDWLNKRMERTEFMPFAPITAVELADRCFKEWAPDHVSSYYMTITYDCTEEMKSNCPAAVHVDGTARPQVVSQNSEATIHELLTRWYEETGGLSLINTSFNMHEEPIVCTPHDAIQSLRRGMIDVLIIGPFEVRRKQS